MRSSRFFPAFFRASHGGGQDESGYGRLDAINTGTIGHLGLAWALDLPGEVTLEATPLAVDAVIYFSGSYSGVYAGDGDSSRGGFSPGAAMMAADLLCARVKQLAAHLNDAAPEAIRLEYGMVQPGQVSFDERGNPKAAIAAGASAAASPAAAPVAAAPAETRVDGDWKMVLATPMGPQQMSRLSLPRASRSAATCAIRKVDRTSAAAWKATVPSSTSRSRSRWRSR